MKKKVSTLLLVGTLVLASVALAGCSTSTEPSTPSPTTTRLTNYTSAKGFAMQYPVNWKASQPRNGGVVVIFQVPTNNTNENVNVQVLPLANSRQTLGNYTQQTLSQISKNSNYKLIGQGDVTLGGNAAHEVIYNATVNKTTMQIMHVWTFHGGSVYFFTYKATPARYDQYVDTVDEMLNSFYFT